MDLFILHLKKQVEQNAPTLTTKIIDNDITGVTRFGKVDQRIIAQSQRHIPMNRV